MTTARNHNLFLHEPTFYHLMSRCVRRAFLCGKDNYSGKCYDHRKDWLEQRLFELADIFFIDLYGYAIMSNHYHLVVKTRPDLLRNVSARDIAIRWCKVYPNNRLSDSDRIDELLKDTSKLKQCRKRLGDISWFMHRLNEPIARRANKEDQCSGRFWQGRFKSQLLLDESAVYTCMAYVDLNPVRAGLSLSPEQSEYTSLAYRLRHHDHIEPIKPLNKSDEALSFLFCDYIILADQANQSIRDHSSKCILEKAKPLLEQLRIRESGYCSVVKNLSRLFNRAVGRSCLMKELGKKLDQNWVKGVGIASQIFR